MRMLEIDLVTAEVTTVLADAGIPSLLLKGPVLARWLYDSEDQRPYIDCDLLIPEALTREAERVLKLHGFERGGFDSIADDRPKYAIPLRRGDGPQVDLHRTLEGVHAPSASLWNEITSGAERMRVGGEDVDVPPPAARTLVLALHAMKDGSRSAKVRRDLEQAAQRVPVEVWRAGARIAEKLGALDGFAAGLRREPATAKVADYLGLPSGVSTEVALRLDSPRPLAVGLHWLLTSGLRGKGRWILKKVFPPKAFMRQWSGLARRGHLGLAVAYLWRPLWLVWRIVPALVAVLRARRAALGSGAARRRDGLHE